LLVGFRPAIGAANSRLAGGARAGILPVVKFQWCRTIVVLLLVLSLGAHWILLQSIAWVGMIVTYSQNTTFTQAVRMTFDGEHPCPLCKFIQEGRAAEKQPDADQVRTSAKPELALLPKPLTLVFSPDRPAIPAGDLAGLERRDAPPKPRPRIIHSGDPA
jgi:hypothetical protein